MTDQQLRLFLAVEKVLQAQSASFDDLCESYAAAFEKDAAEATNPLVKGCLQDAASGLRSAGMDWYVSTK